MLNTSSVGDNGLYEHIFTDLRDPRVDSWALMASPWPTFILCSIYYWIVRWDHIEIVTIWLKERNTNSKQTTHPNPLFSPSSLSLSLLLTYIENLHDIWLLSLLDLEEFPT